MREVRDVDAAGRDVGRDHELHFSALHLGHHPLALLLRQIAVEQLGIEAVAVQHVGDELGVGARVAEDDGVFGVLALEQVQQVARLGVLVDDVIDDVGDVLDRVHVAGKEDRLRVAQVFRGEMLDVGRDGRGEEERLPIRRQVVENARHFLVEAGGEHLVRLVQHRDARVGKLERPAADVIVDAARRSDDHLGAGGEGLRLRSHRRAAVHRDDGDVLVPGERLELLRHLQRQLARIAQDERARFARPPGDALEQRNAEGGGLPRPGLAAADDVLAGHDRAEHGGLHGSRSRVSAIGDPAAQLVGQRQIRKLRAADVIVHSLNREKFACIAPRPRGR